SWSYRFPVAPGDRCRIELTLSEPELTAPEVVVPGPDGKPIASKSEFAANDKQTYATVWTMPQSWPLGSHISVAITAKTGAINVKQVRFVVTPQDLNGDGFPEYLSRLMTQGLPPAARPVVLRSPSRPYTVFQSG